MKQLYFIGGTMGVGKTATCQILKKKLNKSVLLDGDWCWDMHPFIVTEETKEMVIRNICFLLNNFIHCSAYENIIFCWVMHEQPTIDNILEQLDTTYCQLHSISLIANDQALKKRLEKDISAGTRSKDIIRRSVERISLYDKLSTEKIDVSEISPEQVADYIIKNC